MESVSSFNFLNSAVEYAQSNGLNPPQNKEEAVSLLQGEIEKTNLIAVRILIQAFLENEYAPQEERFKNLFLLGINVLSLEGDLSARKAFLQIINNDVKKEDPNALFNAGIIHEHGLFVPKNEAKAVNYYLFAAKKGTTEAMIRLAKFFKVGFSQLKQDQQKSFQCYLAAAKLGNSDAMFKLGKYYTKGIGCEKNEARAFELFGHAAAKEHVGAMYRLGICYDAGLGVAKNVPNAFTCYQGAANKGDPYAKYELAKFYQYGETGVQKDLKKANQLFQEAADIGILDAMFRLGRNYKKGKGIEMDMRKAADLYQKAALGGHGEAIYKLGLFYMEEKSLPQDEAKGLSLCKNAFSSGCNDAHEYLSDYYSSVIPDDVPSRFRNFLDEIDDLDTEDRQD